MGKSRRIFKKVFGRFRSGKPHVQTGEDVQAATDLRATENPNTTDNIANQTLPSTVGDASVFSYEPFGPDDHLRLLELCPASDPEAQIECRLSTHGIHKSPPFYEALSYTWGTEPATMCILVNNAIFYIRSNLYSALKRLRSPDRSRLLWIDAICVNQDDLEDRNFQVLAMRYIFQIAGNAIIWLGKGDSSSDRAMKFLKTTSDRYMETEDGPGEPYNLTSRLEDMTFYNYMRDVVHLLQRPWWTRTWVVQEVAMSRDPYRTSILCGTEEISWYAMTMLCCVVFQTWVDKEYSLRDQYIIPLKALIVLLWGCIQRVTFLAATNAYFLGNSYRLCHGRLKKGEKICLPTPGI
jgi:hypothetical protein